MKKITAVIIIIEIFLSIIFSNASAAISTELISSGTEKDTNKKTQQGYTVDVDTVIKHLSDSNNEVQNKIDEDTFEYGIFITEESREYFLNLINNFTIKDYIINSNGFLTENDSSSEKKQNKISQYYTNKIDELMNRKKKIIISVDENYKTTNESGEILNIKLENDEYALKFEKNEETEIIILNKFNYNNQYDENLLNKFLELFYYDDSEFIEFVDSQDIQRLDNKINPLYKEENKWINSQKTQEDILNNNLITNKIKNIKLTSDITNFDLMLTTIKYKIENITQEKIQKNKEDLKGIWIEESSRKTIIDFLNNHGIYTYNTDTNGYLICDFIKKNNPNLDFDDVTELDLEIMKALEENIIIYLGIGSQYLESENNKLKIVNLDDNQILKTISNLESSKRVVLLNKKYFYKEQGYNVEISDRFVKSLIGNNETTIMPRSDTSKYGNMISSQTVYAGPDNSNYATVGSVDANEQVYILGKSAGWYHIQYLIGTTGKQKSGFVPMSTITNIVAPLPIHEEILTGGYRYANNTITVYSCDDLDIALSVGTVFEGEGITLIYDYEYSENNKNYQIAFIEYSTSTGTKRGYTYLNNLSSPIYDTSVARITATSTAYAGPDTAYVKIGGAYSNEYVAILAKNSDSDWVLVEYNTSSGRKRGFMNYSKMNNCNPKGSYQILPAHQNIKKATQDLTVYGGPDSDYSNSGLIYNQEIISYLNAERGYAYIEYSTTGGAKRGYVLESALIDATLPTLPEIPTYTNFTKHFYGTSGLGTNLPYYKIGNGADVAFVVFEQHGWEDAWAADGIELVNIAQRVMNNLSVKDLSIFDGWTLYIIPYANPDGITNGYSNNGPGRCTVTSKVDMNRCWPASFTSVTNISRNYTGSSPLGATEAVQLLSFLQENESENGMTILVDVHGWYNTTYGNPDVGAYFTTQFGFLPNNDTYGQGYLSTWGAYRGYKSSLVELPMPSSSTQIINSDYSGKMTNAIVNMLKHINKNYEDSGTKVDEAVRITGSESVRLRSIPTTSGVVVTNVLNGTLATRIKKDVAINDGFSWDKIVLQDGTTGYMATNYLQLVEGSTSYAKYMDHEDIKTIKAYLKYEKLQELEINNTYDNELINAVEVFQQENQINETGNLDIITLQAMGFSTNSEDRIEHNDYFNTYSNIANLYMSIYARYETTSDTNKYIIFGQETCQLDNAYKTQKNTQDALYSSIDVYSLSENDRSKIDDTIYTLQNLVTQFSQNYPKSAAALQRYLSNTGDVLVFSELNTWFNTNAQRELRNTYIERFMRASEQFITQSSNNFAKSALEYHYATNMGIGTENNRMDWFAAVNSTQMSVVANTNKLSNDRYRMEITFQLRDYYDWGNDYFMFPTFPPTIVAEEDIRMLHYCGLAKNFESTCVPYTLIIEWNQGETFNEQSMIIQ